VQNRPAESALQRGQGTGAACFSGEVMLRKLSDAMKNGRQLHQAAFIRRLESGRWLHVCRTASSLMQGIR
jgi:hypothetical protein